jgi:hypothetical protein
MSSAIRRGGERRKKEGARPLRRVLAHWLDSSSDGRHEREKEKGEGDEHEKKKEDKWTSELLALVEARHGSFRMRESEGGKHEYTTTEAGRDEGGKGKERRSRSSRRQTA